MGRFTSVNTASEKGEQAPRTGPAQRRNIVKEDRREAILPNPSQANHHPLSILLSPVACFLPSIDP
jgi:hypothetical protein